MYASRFFSTVRRFSAVFGGWMSKVPWDRWWGERKRRKMAKSLSIFAAPPSQLLDPIRLSAWLPFSWRFIAVQVGVALSIELEGRWTATHVRVIHQESFWLASNVIHQAAVALDFDSSGDLHKLWEEFEIQFREINERFRLLKCLQSPRLNRRCGMQLTTKQRKASEIIVNSDNDRRRRFPRIPVASAFVRFDKLKRSKTCVMTIAMTEY